MAKNTGKPSEEHFEAVWGALGKRAYLHRFVDAAEIVGRTGKIGFSRKAPADYLLVHNGQTEFAEVKSTQNATSFPFSLLQVGQTAAAAMAIAAGGSYFVYAHRLSTDEWFRFPYALVVQTKALGKASIPWNALKEHAWTTPM